jgi:hypothetical protein
MVVYARFIKSQARRIAKEIHQQLGVVVLGAMWTLANVVAQQTLVFQITSPLPLIIQSCITPTQHAALQMITPWQSALQSQILLRAMPRMNALTQEPHVPSMLLVFSHLARPRDVGHSQDQLPAPA